MTYKEAVNLNYPANPNVEILLAMDDAVKITAKSNRKKIMKLLKGQQR